MTDLYRQLIQDHTTLTKVLHALEHSVSRYDEGSEHEPNLPLILDTLEYIQVYPEKFHHPLEEQAFSYLLKHNLGDEKMIKLISEQHQTLEQKTIQLCQQFNAIANDYVVPITEINAGLKDYIEAQKRHLEMENKYIFPTLAELDQQAWWDIASKLVIRGDPLFSDDPQRQTFTALATAIIEDQHG